MLSPRPTQRAIAASYELEAGVHAVWEQEEEGRKLMWAKRAQRVRSLSPMAGRALDIGAGFGDFLLAMVNAGWYTVGTEISAAAVEEARGRGVDEMRLGQHGDCELDGESFDLVSMWHVLEHLPEPGDALADCAGYLRPGGLLVVAVPNDGLFPRLSGAYLRRTIRRSGSVGSSWLYPLPGEEIHLSFFSLRVLADAVQAAGLRVESVGIDDYHPDPSPATDRRYRQQSAIQGLTGVSVGKAIFLAARRPLAP